MCIGISKCSWTKLFAVFTLTFSATAFAEVKIEKAWVQLAPPGAKYYAAYLHLQNPGDVPVIIQSLSADCCQQVMLHRTRVKNNKATMEHLEELAIPAQGKVVMKPGGLHIMLMKAAMPLKVDDNVELNLHLASGEQQTISVPVIGYDE